MKVKTRFQIGSACILLLFCALTSVVIYKYLKDAATERIYRETEIFIGTADATRTYVKDVLRPKVAELVAEDDFIPHAMSTSFVGREIMSRLRERFPDFQYKRAARNPTNPINQADSYELSMLDWFTANPEAREWHGLIQKDNQAYYSRLRAIYAEKECLLCHGNPADAPRAMKELYGGKGGYGYRPGEVVAADTIYIPVQATLFQVKETAWLVFLLAVTSLLALTGLFYLLFNRTVVFELKGLLSNFRRIVDPQEHTTDEANAVTGDEVDQLKQGFEQVASDLQSYHDELKASESKYRLLFESSQEAILIIDAGNRIADINDAGVRLFGFKNRTEALSVETFFQLFWDTRDADTFLKTIGEKGFVRGVEYDMVERMGRQLTVTVSATARTDEVGHPRGIEAVLHNVSEKRRLEKYLAQTEKLASIGQLAAGVAHEINNPLGVIQCYANLIAKAHPEESQELEDIRIINKHSSQCKSVVEALLNFARVTEPEMSEVDIHRCIDGVLAVLESQMQKDGITIARSYGQDIPILTIDESKIGQVVMNLVINARQAMPDGGQLHVQTRLEAADGRVAVVFRDTGKGIASKILEKIFDPFFTTKGDDQGTGLGLSVSYGIIKQHGGDIEVDSKVGQGSTFTAWLPVNPNDAETPADSGP
jgi:PAS domain S-box-containing protein